MGAMKEIMIEKEENEMEELVYEIYKEIGALEFLIGVTGKADNELIKGHMVERLSNLESYVKELQKRI